MSIVDERPAQPATREPDDPGHPVPGSTIDLTQPTGSGRPTFTITDAATACAVSRKTITRKLSDLAGHGASKDDDGIWRIPVEALLAVGLHPGRSLPRDPGQPLARTDSPSPQVVAEPPASPRPATGPDLVSIPRERWDDLRLRLARAEAEASERAAALADARLALRALTAAPSRPEPVAAVPAAPVALQGAIVPPAPRKRRWWQARESA